MTGNQEIHFKKNVNVDQSHLALLRRSLIFVRSLLSSFGQSIGLLACVPALTGSTACLRKQWTTRLMSVVCLRDEIGIADANFYSRWTN